jgi:symplekin
MRTVIQSLVHWPKAVDSIMSMLRHLLSRRVWEMPKLWAGFVRCCQMAMPASAGVYLAMPRDKLEAAVKADAAVKEKLVAHAKAHRGEVPEPALAALGIA